MDMQIFLILLLVVSVMTTLFTEGLKKIFDEWGKEYCSNTIAGVVSIVLGAACWWGYIIMTETAITAKMFVILLALAFLSWLSAMLGYDKVKQSILQIIELKANK